MLAGEVVGCDWRLFWWVTVDVYGACVCLLVVVCVCSGC